MPAQTVKKSELSQALNRWMGDAKLLNADRPEVTAEHDMLIIRKAQQGICSHSSLQSFPSAFIGNPL